MAAEWRWVVRGSARFEALRCRVDMLAGGLRALAVADATLDSALEVVNALVGQADALLVDCLGVLQRGGPEALERRAIELVRMKQRIWALAAGHARAVMGVEPDWLRRMARDDLADSRALVASARRLHGEAVAA